MAEDPVLLIGDTVLSLLCPPPGCVLVAEDLLHSWSNYRFPPFEPFPKTTGLLFGNFESNVVRFYEAWLGLGWWITNGWLLCIRLAFPMLIRVQVLMVKKANAADKFRFLSSVDVTGILGSSHPE